MLVTCLRHQRYRLVLKLLRLLCEQSCDLLGWRLLMGSADTPVLVTSVKVGRDAPHKEVPLAPEVVLTALIVYREWIKLLVESVLEALTAQLGDRLTLLQKIGVRLLYAPTLVLQQLEDVIDAAGLHDYIYYFETGEASSARFLRQHVRLIGAVAFDEGVEEVFVCQLSAHLQKPTAK